MPRDPYQRLYEDSELYALHLVRRAAGPTLHTDTRDALHHLAHRNRPLQEHDAALAVTGALARLAYTALRTAADRLHLPGGPLPAATAGPAPGQVREITEVLDRLDAGLLATDTTTFGHAFVELTRLALAEQLPGGSSLRDSAAPVLARVVGPGPTPGPALLQLVVRGAELTLECLHHIFRAQTATGWDPGAAIEQVLDGFELYKLTEHGAGAQTT
ncbi:hypothetical protein AB0D08_38340 [Kitasatospora sp. NPDC048540]|uniref:hypothetical protein n=1 Tax=Kitasatospora sp. NPDC048540 TaxID=3155634 RepID=UPI0033FC03C7